MELRVSDKVFSAKDSSIKWYRVTAGQKKIFAAKDENGDYLRGKYFQWRAHLAASPDGAKSPMLKKVGIRYRVDSPPVVPMSFEVAQTGDRYIILRWKKNVEADLGGYRIYYGTKKGIYDGIISAVNGNKITNRISDGNYITVKIDNAVIEENKIADGRKVLIYPSIENTVLYYFAVTSYDTYKENTVYNHESGLSSCIEGRPYAGSDIR